MSEQKQVRAFRCYCCGISITEDTYTDLIGHMEPKQYVDLVMDEKRYISVDGTEWVMCPDCSGKEHPFGDFWKTLGNVNEREKLLGIATLYFGLPPSLRNPGELCSLTQALSLESRGLLFTSVMLINQALKPVYPRLLA